MASLGKITIETPLRRVTFHTGRGAWLHGFFQGEKGPMAVIELDNGQLTKYSSLELLTFDEPYSHDTAYEQKSESHVDVLRLSYPLSEYVGKLERNGEIHYEEGESVWDIALRCWRADHEKLKKYDSVIRLMEEVGHWKLSDAWDTEDFGDGFCWRCSKKAVRNEDNLCFECWTKLHEAKHILESSGS